MSVSLARFVVVLWTVVASATALTSSASDDQAKSTTGEAAQGFRGLTPGEVHARMQRGQIVVFDANPTDIFAKNHVPGARWVDYDLVATESLPSDKSAAIVFYCMNERCRASHMAAQRARALGWSDIYLMPKGIQGWIEAGLATASGSSDTPQALEVHRRQNFLRLTTETFS